MINDKQFRTLAAYKGKYLISIFIPTYRAGHAKEDRLRFKNALSEASKRLESAGAPTNEARKILRPGQELLEDSRFWLHLSDGLCFFAGPDFSHYEIMPITFDARVSIGRSFLLSPLLPVLNHDSRFFLLALSQNEIRFFEGSRYSITPVQIEDLVPKDMASLFELSDAPGTLQHHGSSQQSQVYHGHGYGKDDQEQDLIKYFREVDEGLMQMLHDEQPPMVLACVDYLYPIYKSISKYSRIYPEPIPGNPDHQDAVLLHEKAWSRLGPYFHQQREEDGAQFGERKSKAMGTVEPTEIIPAAAYQKIEVLFLRKGARLPGKFDPSVNQLDITEGFSYENMDLLDFAAVQTYLNGGRVYLMEASEMPAPSTPACAIYRY
ncbi:baeRF7 domain-containing protein [Phaeodactylibacter luteus]|uniref:Uncharacterized protein n=1 Tax=Phaeodactylibacter luteus TaxID=1564516 RepID=A0A5C6RVG0_9BACT|nr:hypothetical protein [Phaeodactylibacter luteus]TXB65540.1 hypothetical protein FRY97_06045 [Phaeodactylibacter luteus]